MDVKEFMLEVSLSDELNLRELAVDPECATEL